ncbi:MAG: hypothetical protein ASARMPRED_000026 [Alectoria sarmentosa]|nr:MAG: hypothetical protein ASARMPRED_000026 [Alectoria sarmentosa]
MTSSARSRPSGTSNRQRTGPIPLPTYQPPQNPLNENAIRAIQDLHRNHKLDSLKLRLNAAHNHLAGAAVDINDRLVAQIALHEKSRARREKQGSQDDNGEGERVMDEKRERTDELTNRLESGVRKIIDAKFEVEGVEKALRELETNVANNRGAITPTQSTLGASQFRNRRGRGGNADDEDGEFEDDTQSGGENGSAMEFIKRKIREQKSTYQNETMSFRYAQNNDYVGFKKLVYDAQFPGDDAPPMPHSSTWFSDQSPDSSAPHTRGAATAAAAGNPPTGNDDDLAVASERISIKCPITLLPMKDPVTSTKCPHSFEKEAILSMINASDVRVDGGGRRGAGGKKAMQCPVCTVMLTTDDVAANPVLVRKIKRIQAAEDARIQDDSDDDDDDVRAPAGGRPRAEEISSSPPRTRTPHFKSERRSQAGLVREEQGRPSSSAATDVVDLEEEDEDLEEEEEEEDVEEEDGVMEE